MSRVSQASWTRVDSAGVRLHFFDVDWGWTMNLTGPSPDTLIGVVNYQGDFLPRHARVVLARISCQTAFITTSSGLAYHILVQGGGDTAIVGSSATIHEMTTLMNGSVIFNSHKNNSPITFRIGANQVIKGVDEGVTGMRVGERRRLLVPASLSARSSYPANTPRDSTLRIDVELIGVKRP